MLGGCRNIYTKGRAGEPLAIGAVADVERIGIDLRLEGDLAAMAVSVDLHGCLPCTQAQCVQMCVYDHNWHRVQRQRLGHPTLHDRDRSAELARGIAKVPA
jgi:hypothetical protein